MRFSLSVGSAVAAATSILLALSGQQASAQASRPDAVGMVTVEAATSTSLTLSWPPASGARNYLVERGNDLGMQNRVVVSRTETERMTVSGLQPGTVYCFEVRGVNAEGLGGRSHHACQSTVGIEGSRTGPIYRVVTYNLCSRVCPGWNSRRADAAALVAARRPDIVMLTEATPDSGMAGAIGGMTQVQAKSGKALLYRTKAFTLFSRDGNGRTGFLDLGSHTFAVWAELVDRKTGQHAIFVGVHLSPGKDSPESDDRRRQETTNLAAGIRRINPQGLPVVVAGDFNSYAQRRYDAPGDVLRGAGLADSFWRAHKWKYGNYNSANGGSAVPEVGESWGRHLDQVWAEPGRTQVLKWRNAASLENGRYVPLPSNHSPVFVKLRINL